MTVEANSFCFLLLCSDYFVSFAPEDLNNQNINNQKYSYSTEKDQKQQAV